VWPLGRFLERFIMSGTLGVVDADDRFHRFGPSDPGGRPDVIILLRDRSLYWKLALYPEFYLGEAYMDGTLEITRGTVSELLDLCGRNFAALRHRRHGALVRGLIRLTQHATQLNSRQRALKNVVHHYDLSRELYGAFLDQDLQYSCAYFTSPALTLDEAQAAKKRHLAAKLLLEKNQKVLDIGCGWGGLAIELARNHDVRIDGVSLSKEQLNFARAMANASGVSERARFFAKDYRELTDEFDRIVSVGMFEHVGVPYYPAFFAKIAQLLAPRGVALVHTIGATDGPGISNPWIRKYIFPGGYIPALSEILPVIERAGLIVTDIEVLRTHYAETLRHWRERFLANWDNLRRYYDDRFRRMWEFYLAASEMSFRHGALVVFQIQLAKDPTAVPVTRDYVYEFEQAAVHNSAAMREQAA
jgi:cyclopropane-fatty-acyl-phospholipid synthase